MSENPSLRVRCVRCVSFKSEGRRLQGKKVYRVSGLSFLNALGYFRSIALA
ncbi:MAG: hypothetical protein F6K41_27670 [Symploca sp. SIO3E6]|nr:hypothetical protein [Caldora sp. SIO3E6]